MKEFWKSKVWFRFIVFTVVLTFFWNFIIASKWYKDTVEEVTGEPPKTKYFPSGLIRQVFWMSGLYWLGTTIEINPNKKLQHAAMWGALYGLVVNGVEAWSHSYRYSGWSYAMTFVDHIWGVLLGASVLVLTIITG